MTVEADSFQVLKTLAEWSEEENDPNTGHYVVSGKELQAVLNITANQINDAVNYLVNLGQAKVSQALGTAPFSFTKVSLETAGRHAFEELSSKQEETKKEENNYENEYDVFISHSSLDDPLTTNVKKLLEANNIHVFSTPGSIPTGAWEPQIENALRNSSSIWLLLTRNAIKESVWAHQEFGYFYGYNHGKGIDPKGHKCRFLYTRDTELRGLYVWIQGTQIESFEDPVLVARTIADGVGRDFKVPDDWAKETSPQPLLTLPGHPATFTHKGSGLINTPPFNIDTSPWVLQFSTNWSGHFAVQIWNDGPKKLVVNQSVKAGEVYETHVYQLIGINLYFTIKNAPAEGVWTLSVIKIT